MARGKDISSALYTIGNFLFVKEASTRETVKSQKNPSIHLRTIQLTGKKKKLKSQSTLKTMDLDGI